MADNRRLLILISNDDGVQASGLRHLVDCVNGMGLDADIYAVAPAGHCSGQSSAITVDTPLRVIPHPDYHGAKVYAVTGTPVDCVKLGIHAVLPRYPDLVLSGMNHGSNSGNSNIYSGTMGAAMEACMMDIPAIGFSLLDYRPDADFAPSTPFVQKIISTVLTNGLPDQVCLNVNVPARCTPEGIKVTRCSRGRWTEEYADYVDPHGRPFYMLTGVYEDSEPDNPATDNYWLTRRYVTVTPIRPDQTALDAVAALSTILDD
ncbi:MAG: 5'/3'-nucleotidase SurE [Muribaculaceae bacterium]|nr:5'/3'-nucleotidase SurE [Muribaculaceae bacterium]